MEPFNAGWLSIVPPIVAIALALITKEVLSSLVLGILTGTLIYTIGMDGNVLMGTLESAFTVMGNKVDFNILIFCSLLGALVYVVAMSGGTKAYGNWAVKRIKGRKSALAATTGLGALIFIDDYFNCLTVGAVMRPVTDKFRISHEKLAWIIDSTAAPVCIIAPVSSWAVAMGGYMGENGFNTFVASIPYNLYALVTIVFVFAMCGFGKDFFSMGKAQRDCDAHTYSPIPPHASALETVSKAGIPSNPEAVETVITEQSDLEGATKAVEQFKGLDVSPNGKVFDLVIPIVVLIVFSITGMLL